MAEPPNRCGGCEARWYGLSMAHCSASGCHLTFGGVGNFDQHRVGPTDQRTCLTVSDLAPLGIVEIRVGVLGRPVLQSPSKPSPRGWQ